MSAVAGADGAHALVMSADHAELQYVAASGKFSISYWLKWANGAGADQTVLAKYSGAGPLLRLNTTANKPSAFCVNAGLAGVEPISTVSVNNNAWRNVIVIFDCDGDTSKIYVDGGSVVSSALANMSADTTPWRIFSRLGFGNALEAGAKVAEVCMAQHAFSAQDIADIAAGISPASLAVPVDGYWTLLSDGTPTVGARTWGQPDLSVSFDSGDHPVITVPAAAGGGDSDIIIPGHSYYYE